MVAFYLGDPQAAFARLRREDPLHWYDEGQFWCVLKHADVAQISRTPRVFSSAHGTQLFEVKPRLTGQRQIGENAPSIIRMDPPEHNRHRKIAIGAFTPRQVARLEPRVRALARESLAAVEPGVVSVLSPRSTYRYSVFMVHCGAIAHSTPPPTA